MSMTHPILDSITTEEKVALEESRTEGTKEIIRTIRAGIADRQVWIKSREEQNAALEELQRRALEAYDHGEDDLLVEIAAEVQEVLKRTTKYIGTPEVLIETANSRQTVSSRYNYAKHKGNYQNRKA